MIPLRDIIPSRTTPWVTMGIIGVNVVVFLVEVTLPERELTHFYFTWGLIPASPSIVSALTSMFVHSGWVHVIGNLWSLWIFGDNVEDRLGHVRYLLFYLTAGLIAAYTQVWFSSESPIPLIGASGAIAGVMGAYFVLFPTSRVLALVFLFLFVDVIEIPAVFFLGFWFLSQLASGVGQLGTTDVTGGVAFWAHAGGFLTGLLGVWLFKRPERQRVDWWS